MDNDDFRVQALERFIKLQCEVTSVVRGDGSVAWYVRRPLGDDSWSIMTVAYSTQEEAIEAAMVSLCKSLRVTHRAAQHWEKLDGR